MRNTFCLLSCLVLLNAFVSIEKSQAAEPILASVPSASVVGSGVLTYAFWDVYEATLFAPQGQWDPSKPYGLSIEYFHSIKGGDIADTSVQEMRKIGFQDEEKLADWNMQMKAIFPNVENGTVLSAAFIPGQHTVFYKGNQVIGQINGDDFGRMFFGIWLNEKTSKPDLRRALLGLS